MGGAAVQCDVRRLDVLSGGFKLAAELHMNTVSRGPLVCFVPGGAVDRERSRPITSRWERQQLRALAAVGASGLTLNFPGVGRSSGELADNTLERRARWVTDVVDAAAPSRHRTPLVLVGCSMGAHVAAMLATELATAALVLIAPAAYSRESIAKPFGPRFREAIRKPGSWSDSPALAALARYDGPVLLLFAQRDEIVPADVGLAYEHAAGARGSSVVLSDASHHVLSSDRVADVEARIEVCRRVAAVARAAVVADVRANSARHPITRARALR